MQFQDELAGGIVLIRPALQSPDYVAGASGWAIKVDGSAEFNNVTIRGSGTADPLVVGPAGMPQVIVRTTPTNGLIVFPTNRPIEADAATLNSAVIDSGAADERAELQMTGPTVNGAPLGVRLVLSSRPQDASDVARLSIQNRDGTDVYFTADGDQVLATGRPLTAERALAADVALRTHITGEAQPRLTATADGGLQWGPGSAGPDTNLYRGAAGVLQTDDTFVVLGELHPRNLVRARRDAVTDSQYETRVTGDANARWFLLADGRQWWGSGSATVDTNLYRSAANTLRTDDDLIVGQDLDVLGAFTANNVQSGTVEITPTVANEWTANTAVTFPETFPSTPVVMLTCTAGGPNPATTTELEMCAASVTTTGFNCRIRRGNLTPTTLSWFAVST